MSQFQSKSIYDTLKLIQEYELVLPSFQREYVWRPEQVERLFDSLMKGYPINSMLFWKVSRRIKSDYRFYKVLDSFIERKKTHNDEFNTSQKDTFMAIIDGQQRLTSLNLGLKGTYAYRRKHSWVALDSNYPTRRLYLNLTKQLTDEENGMTYNFKWLEDGTTGQQDLYVDINDCRWLRVGKVLDFRDEVAERSFLRENTMTVEEESVLAKLYRTVFDGDSINFYVVDSEEPDVAVDVFVRTNSGGTTLNYADILMSIAVANWEQRKMDARTEIHNLVDTVNTMGFDMSHDYVLKAMLYVNDRDVRMRITSFGGGLLDEVAAKWEDLKQAITAVFRLMKLYGLNGGRLPSNMATLPVLYYVWKKGVWNDIVDSVTFDYDRTAIRRWVLRTLLLRTFGYRQDWALRHARMAMADTLLVAFPSKEIDDAIGQRMTDELLIDEILAYQYDNRYAWVVLQLLYTGRTFDGATYHLDHIHSANECIKHGLDKNVWNSVVNLQLLTASENESKSDKALEEWVSSRLSRTSCTMPREIFLSQHFIPDVSLSIDDFDAFIEARKAMLKERLRTLLQ